jgi:hypothetical protein
MSGAAVNALKGQPVHNHPDDVKRFAVLVPPYAVVVLDGRAQALVVAFNDCHSLLVGFLVFDQIGLEDIRMVAGLNTIFRGPRFQHDVDLRKRGYARKLEINSHPFRVRLFLVVSNAFDSAECLRRNVTPQRL